MRIRKLIAIPVLALLLAGCIKEDRDKCQQQENVTFVFSYGGYRGADFTDRIEKIDLFLFDGECKFLLSRSAQTADLDPDYPSMRFDLDPGTYYALAWANVGDNSAYLYLTPGATLLEECLVEIDPACTQTGDPVYYAPRKTRLDVGGTRAADAAVYEVIVPEGEEVVKPLDFVRAHRTIYVWISGLHDTEHPTVEAQSLWSRYDFSFRTHDTRRDYVQQAVEYTKNGTTYSLAVFHHAYGEIDDDMNVLVMRTSDGQPMHTVSVRQFIEDNNITNTDDIHIMLTFSYDLGVTVSVPQWGSAPVQPGAF